LSGTGKYLKERNPHIRVIGADIEGSILSGGAPGSWKVEGIGEDFVPSTLNAQVIDEWIRISDAESFFNARRVAREEGIMLGGSSGTALSAAFKYALRCTADDLIVVLCPDTGRNYLSKMYDDLWMAQNGFMDITPEKTTAGDLLVSLGREGKLIYLLPGDSLRRAADIFREHGISQLPVVEHGKMIGAVQEITIVQRLQKTYGPRGLVVIAPTQHYGYVAGGIDAPREIETRYMAAVFSHYYGGLGPVQVPVSEENFSNYGVSTTPTLVLIDSGGIVRLYNPGVLGWEQLSAAVAAVTRKN